MSHCCSDFNINHDNQEHCDQEVWYVVIQVLKHNTFNIERYHKIVVIHVHSCAMSLFSMYDFRFTCIVMFTCFSFGLIYTCKRFANCSSIAN